MSDEMDGDEILQDIRQDDAEIAESTIGVANNYRHVIGDDPYRWLRLGVVEALEREETGARRLTGRATVQLLGTTGQAIHALLPWGSAGQADFMGGLPLEKSMCVVGWLSNALPVVLAFYPSHYRLLVDSSGKLREMLPGEKLIQAAAPGTKQIGGKTVQTQAPAGSIHLSQGGRIEVASTDRDTVLTVGLEADDEAFKVESHGVTISIDKDGDINLNAGATKLKVEKNGQVKITGTVTIAGSLNMTMPPLGGIPTAGIDGNVILGGSSGGSAIVLASFIDWFNNHSHPNHGARPSQQATSAHQTTRVTAR